MSALLIDRYHLPVLTKEQKALQAEGWQPMATAPKGGYPIQHVQLLEADGTIHKDAHWACDLSGEEQPAFMGWFVPSGSYNYVEVERPKAWRPMQPSI
jgi:hypothetical protein